MHVRIWGCGDVCDHGTEQPFQQQRAFRITLSARARGRRPARRLILEVHQERRCPLYPPIAIAVPERASALRPHPLPAAGRWPSA